MNVCNPLARLCKFLLACASGRTSTTPEYWKRDGLQHLQWGIRTGGFLSTWPFILDPSGIPRVDDSTRGKVLWYLNASTSLLMFLFCSSRSIYAITTEETPTSTKIYLQLVSTIHLIPVVFNLAGLVGMSHLACCMQYAIPFFQKYEETNPRIKGSLMYRLLPWTQLGIRYGVNANCVLILGVLFTNPHSPENVLSVLPESLSGNFLCRAFVHAAYVIWFNSVRVNAVFVGVFLLYVSIWSYVILRDLSEKLHGHVNAEQLVAEWKTYRELQIVVKEFNKAIQVLLPAVKLVVIIPAVLAAYAVIRLDGVISWMCGVYSFDTVCFLEIVLSFLAQLWVHSSEFLHSAKCNVSRRSVLGKQIRATMPTAVKVADGMYFVDKQLVRTVTDVILTNTVNILMIGKSAGSA